MNRNLVAAYINQANAILAKILESPRSKEVTSLLSAADQKAIAALNTYQTLDYASSAYYAKDAYLKSLNDRADFTNAQVFNVSLPRRNVFSR
jgi:hypothetical protein